MDVKNRSYILTLTYFYEELLQSAHSSHGSDPGKPKKSRLRYLSSFVFKKRKTIKTKEGTQKSVTGNGNEEMSIAEARKKHEENKNNRSQPETSTHPTASSNARTPIKSCITPSAKKSPKRAANSDKHADPHRTVQTKERTFSSPGKGSCKQRKLLMRTTSTAKQNANFSMKHRNVKENCKQTPNLKALEKNMTGARTKGMCDNDKKSILKRTKRRAVRKQADAEMRTKTTTIANDTKFRTSEEESDTLKDVDSIRNATIDNFNSKSKRIRTRSAEIMKPSRISEVLRPRAVA